MSQYVKIEGDKGNTNLKLQVNGITTTAILDTGAGISIITKQTWENWGRESLVKTRMGLQLAGGEIKYSMGMLEDMNVNICGIPFVHTFAVVDFTQETNYDVILGQPFMRQMLLFQDWGYNRLYLCYRDSIVKINLDDHTYRDVTRMLVEDFESSLV